MRRTCILIMDVLILLLTNQVLVPFQLLWACKVSLFFRFLFLLAVYLLIPASQLPPNEGSKFVALTGHVVLGYHSCVIVWICRVAFFCLLIGFFPVKVAGGPWSPRWHFGFGWISRYLPGIT